MYTKVNKLYEYINEQLGKKNEQNKTTHAQHITKQKRQRHTAGI